MIVGRIENGVVVEAFLVDEVPPHMVEWSILPDEAGAGWLLDGNVWSAPVIVEPVPEKVSRFQARAALFQSGLLEAAEAITQAAGGEILIAWQDAGEFQRLSLAINGLAFHLGLTANDVDNLFRLAATKTA